MAGPGSTVSGNTANNNGSDGISANRGATVQRNTVRLNGGFGLNLSPNIIGPLAAYRENVVDLNLSGTVLGGVDAGANVCNGTLTCP